jgi:hypothetical protein
MTLPKGLLGVRALATPRRATDGRLSRALEHRLIGFDDVPAGIATARLCAASANDAALRIRYHAP